MPGRGWRDLAEHQGGMLSLAQLRYLGVTRAETRHHIAMERWRHRTSSVISTTTGPLSREQQLWMAVLHGGPTALIGGLSAAEVHGMRNWHRDDITVVVDDDLSFEPLPGVIFFRSRRPCRLLRARKRTPHLPDRTGDSALRRIRAEPPHRSRVPRRRRSAAPDDTVGTGDLDRYAPPSPPSTRVSSSDQ